MATIDDVRQIYANILQRSGTEVTAAEINSYVSAIDSGALTLAQARSALINSTEGQDVQDVVRLYQTVFGRVPDQAGLNNQVDTLRGAPTEADIANSFAASPEFTTRFGGNVVNSAFINSVYQQVLGRTPSASEVDFYLNSGFSAGRIALAFSEAPEFRVRVDGAVSTFLDQAGQGTAVFSGPLMGTTGPVNNGASFTLTTNADGAGAAAPAANLTATANNDTFNALVDGATPANTTLNLADTVNGGAGNDTLSLRTIGTANVGPTTTPTLTSIEAINVTALSGAATIALGVAPAATSVASVSSIGTVSFTGASKAVTSVSVSNTAADNADVSVTYVAGLTGTTDAVTLNVSNNSSATTGTANTFAEVTLTGAAAGDGVDIVNVVSADAATRLDKLTVVDGAAASTLTTLNISGAQGFRVNEAIAFAGTTGTVDASKATGAVNLTFGANDLTVTGGSGADRFNFGTSFTSADKLNGGGNTDTLAIGSDIVANATASAAEKALVTAINATTSIEVLELTQTAAALSATDLTTINTFAFSGATSVAVTNVEANDSFQLLSDLTGNASFAAKLDTGSDVLTLSSTGADLTGNLVATNFETVNLTVTNGPNADDTTFAQFQVSTNGKINVTGAGDVNLGTLVGTNATVDASALTGKLTVVGEAGNNTIIGGSGNDIIAGGDGQDQITITSGGTDVVRLGITAASRDTVTGFTAGANGDIIDVGTQNATATANDGIGATQYRDITGSSTAFTFATAQTVQEFSFNAVNNSANLASATDGTELFKAIANQGSTITGITAAAGNSAGEIVAYQNGNAYIYHYASVDTTIDATEVVLVGTLTGVAVGALTDANFA